MSTLSMWLIMFGYDKPALVPAAPIAPPSRGWPFRD